MDVGKDAFCVKVNNPGAQAAKSVKLVNAVYKLAFTERLLRTGSVSCGVYLIILCRDFFLPTKGSKKILSCPSLSTEIEQRGDRFYKITGETLKEKRHELVKDFYSDDTSVFLISMKAGGTGLNLTGADMVIHFDPWWNTAAQEQATDRAYRIGQTKKVTVYKLIPKYHRREDNGAEGY